MDILTPAERSKNMAAIRGKDTKPELYIRKLLFSKGYRYRIGSSAVEGHPDIYLSKYKTAVFIHGCFWHRHIGCKYAYMPKSRIEFWTKKFKANIQRDKTVRLLLEQSRIKNLIIWECTIKRMKKNHEYEEKIFNEIEQFFYSKDLYLEL
jgi:DNA mismatch endonuclease vsr